MKIITFGTLKGGSGKTTNVFNIAGVLAQKSRVLLIDMDAQCNLSSDCGVDITDRNIPTVRKILENFTQTSAKPEDIILRSPIDELPKLDIIASSIMLFQTEEMLTTKPAREMVLQHYVEDNRDFFEENYDYILIDTNPSMSIININAFYVSDSIVLSSDVSTNSILGAELFCDLWESKRQPLRKEDNVHALILCNSDRRTKLGLSLQSYANTESFSKDIIIDTIIPSTVLIKNAEIVHKPVNIAYPKKEITKMYNNVVKELKKKGVF